MLLGQKEAALRGVRRRSPARAARSRCLAASVELGDPLDAGLAQPAGAWRSENTTTAADSASARSSKPKSLMLGVSFTIAPRGKTAPHSGGSPMLCAAGTRIVLGLYGTGSSPSQGRRKVPERARSVPPFPPAATHGWARAERSGSSILSDAHDRGARISRAIRAVMQTPGGGAAGLRASSSRAGSTRPQTEIQNPQPLAVRFVRRHRRARRARARPRLVPARHQAAKRDPSSPGEKPGPHERELPARRRGGDIPEQPAGRAEA